MFKKITIQNFRGIENLTIDDFGKVNLLVGKNNSCKTSVLEALFVSLSPNNPILFHNTNEMRGLLDLKITNDNSFIETLQNSLESLFYKLHYNKPIVLSSNFTNPKQSRVIEISPVFSNIVDIKKDSKIISSIATELKNYWKGLNFDFSISGLNKKNKSQIEKFHSEAILVHEKEQNTITTGFKAEEDSKYIEKLQKQNITEFRAKYISFLAGANDSLSLVNLFDEIKIQRKKTELVNLLKKLEPSIKDIDFLKEAFYVDLEGFDKLVRFEILGQGTKKIFSLACHLLGDDKNICENSILFIDEIENGLHYTAQNKLWKFLFELAKEKNIQIFATTHSMDMVRAFAKTTENQEKNLKNGKSLDLNLAKLYRMEKYEDGSFEAIPYKLENISSSLERHLEFR